MKNNIFKKIGALTVTAALVTIWNTTPAFAEEIFNTDFSKGTIEELGWKAKGDWAVLDYGKDRPNLEKNPGPVMRFPGNAKEAGHLTKTFAALDQPKSLTLTFDAGYGWGAKNHSQGLSVMILNDAGDGYIFANHRAKAKWGVQWDVVNKFGFNAQKHWANSDLDTTQTAVVDGGGLRKFTITRDADGNWKFSGDGWGGGALEFTDKTHAQFTQVILVGDRNNDDLLFNNIKLEAEK
ncbi:MAG: hypothetical protein LBK60_08305 [Verrucomicrobiales bacterium]|jgi:hypothetical protein|nr:hypothetical protein [Verrucomicrobiales bacterium]